MRRIKSRGGAHAAKMQFVRMPMWKCIISLVLAFTLAVSLGTNWAYAAEFLPKSAEATQVTLNQTDQDKTVFATEVEGATAYVWQAKLVAGGYANIESSHEATLHINAGLIDNENFLTADNKVTLRSFAVDENGEWFNEEAYVVSYNRNAQAAGQAANKALESAVVSQNIEYLDSEASQDASEANTAEAEANGEVPTNAQFKLTLTFENEAGTQLALPVVNYFDTTKPFKWQIQLKDYLGKPKSATPSPTGLVESVVDSDKYLLTISLCEKPIFHNEVTVKVVSGSATAKYIVAYKLQNLDGETWPDDWEVYSATGNVGSSIPTPEDIQAIEDEIGGILLGQVGNYVTMDGKAEADALFLRAFRLITFDPNGGVEGPDPIYNKVGSTVTCPEKEPHRAGYNFDGWYYDEECTDPVTWEGMTIGHDNITVFAKWTPKQKTANVTLVYYGENPEVSGSVTDPDYYTKNYGYLTEDVISGQSVGSKYTITNAQVVPPGNDPHEGVAFKNLYQCSSKSVAHIVNDGATVTPDDYTTIHIYLKRNTYTWEFHSSTGQHYTRSITARWGQDIYDQYIAICQYFYSGKSFGKWDSGRSGGNTVYTNLLTHMDRVNRNQSDRYSEHAYYIASENDASIQLRYFLQSLDHSFQHGTIWQDDIYGNFEEPPEAYATYRYFITEEEFIVFDGFKTPKANGTDAPTLDPQTRITAPLSFYYEREKYTDQFLNVLTDNPDEPWILVENVQYEKPIGDVVIKDTKTGYEGPIKNYVPQIPTGYDQNFEFKGWCWDRNMTGDIVDINTLTQPSHDIMLYAKWGPPEVTITFDTSTAPQEVRPPASSVDVFYGDDIPEAKIPAEESTFRYRFTSWYSLIDPAKGHIDSNKKYFNPHEMPAPAHDLTLYMEYYDNTQVTYKVHYVYIDPVSGPVDVASPTDGAGVPGTTVTLKAKEGEQLYPDYQMIYNPTSKTHDMVLDDDPTQNVYTFYYDKSGSLKYTVRYVDEDNKDIATPVTKTVTENVAYEEAITIDNYTLKEGEPTAKSILLEQQADKNIIIFHYTENTVDIKYQVYTADTDYGYITAHGSSTPSSLVTDTVKVVSDDQANGATAYVKDAAKEGFEFDGWYDFSAGKLGDKVSDDADFQPEKPADGWVAATYVARFKAKTLTVTFTPKAFQRGQEAPENAGYFIVSGGIIGRTETTWTVLKQSEEAETLTYNMPYNSVYRYGELGFGSTTLYLTNLSDPAGKIDFSKYDIVKIEAKSLKDTKFRFVTWSQDPSTQTPTVDQYIKEDTDFTAEYDYIQYKVHIQTAGHGTVKPESALKDVRLVPYDELIFITDSTTEPAGTYPEGGLSFSSTTIAKIDVEPIPDTNYKFSKWTMKIGETGEESEALAHNKDIAIHEKQPTAEIKDVYLKVYFELNIADATFDVSPEGSGTVSTEKENFVIGTTYTASKDAAGKGVLTFKQAATTVKTVTATPKKGYHFVKWTVDGSDITQTGTIDSPETRAFVAVFEENDPVTYTYVPVYKGEVTEDDNVGSVNPETQQCKPVSGVEGQKPSSTATAGTGYNFEGWYVSDGAGGYTKVGSEATIVIEKTDGVYTGGTYYANFVAKDQTVEIKYAPVTWLYNASGERVTKSTKVGGSVTPDKDVVNIVEGNPFSTASAKINPAYPTLNTGYTFIGWYDGDGASSTKLTADAIYHPEKNDDGVFEAKTYYAHFMENAPVDITYKSYTLTYNAEGNPVYTNDGKGGLVTKYDGTGTPAKEYKETGIAPDSGQPAGSKAIKNNGYHFVGWAFYYPDGDYTEALSEDEAYKPTKLDTEFWSGDVEYAAVFTENAAVSYEYKVKTLNKDGQEITTSVGGKVEPTGESVAPATGTASGSLATAYPGYKFVKWIDAQGGEAGTELKFTPQKTDGAYTGGTYTAVFQTYEITVKFAVDPDHPEAGSILPDANDIKVESTKTYAIDKDGKLSIDTITPDHTVQGVSGTTIYSKWTTGKRGSEVQTQAGNIIEQEVLSDGTPVMYFWAYFEYDPSDIPIYYSVSPYADAGAGAVKLNQTGAVEAQAVSEVVHNTSSDPAIGCLAIAKPGYHFAGWYMDTEEGYIGDTNPYIPTKVGEEGAKYWESHWYYAAFEEDADVTVNYVAKSFLHDGTTTTTTVGGTVTPPSEDIAPATGDPDGSQGTVKAGFSFAGWYTNEACTTVAPGDSKNLHYTPIKDATEGIFKAATYYAKFVENESVTIIYKVSDPNGGSIALKTTNNDQADQVSETVAPATGTAKGAVVTLQPGYHVVNWINGSGQEIKDSSLDYTPAKVEGLNVAGTYTCVIAENADVTINYVAKSFLNNGTSVSPVSGGNVAPPTEDVAPATGNPQGSTGTAIKGFTFKGWFTDEACTQPAPGTSTQAKYIPIKDATQKVYIAATYYAKFVEDADVTINYVVRDAEKHRGGVTVASETHPPVTGVFTGSVSVPNAGYDSLNWTNVSEIEVASGASFVPSKSAEGVYVAATYYAHFSPKTDTAYKIKYAFQDTASIGKTTLTEADFDIVEAETASYTGTTESTIDPYNTKYAKDFQGFYLYQEGSTFDSGQPFEIKGDGTSFGVRFYARNSDTQYTVVHWQQDLNGETYTQVGSEVNKDYTGKTITTSSLANTYEGFTFDDTLSTAKVDGEQKHVTSFEVLADGSQVVNLYYTRNSYDYTVHYYLQQIKDNQPVVGGYDPIPQYDYTLPAKFGETVYSDRPLAEGYHLNNDLTVESIVIKVSDNVMKVYYDRNLDTPYTIKHFFADWDYWGWPTGEYVQNLDYCPDTYGVGVTGATVFDKDHAVYDGQILREIGYKFNEEQHHSYVIKGDPTENDYLRVDYDLLYYSTEIDYIVPQGFGYLHPEEWKYKDLNVVEGEFAVYVPEILGREVETGGLQAARNDDFIPFLRMDRDKTDPEILVGLERGLREYGFEDLYVGNQEHYGNQMNVVYEEANNINVTYQVNDATLGGVSVGAESYGYLQGDPTGSVAMATEAGVFVNWTNEAGEVVSTSLDFVPNRMVEKQDPATFSGDFPDPELHETYIANFKPASENVNAQTGDTTAGVVGIVFAMLMLAGLGLFMGMRRRKPVYQGKHCA